MIPNIIECQPSINEREFLTALYNLFLGREPEASGMTNHIKGLSGKSALWQNVIYTFMTCEERKKLISANPSYFPVKPRCTLTQLLAFCKNKNITKARSYLIQEYAITCESIDYAVEIFKIDDMYDDFYQSYRIMRLASMVNYLDYTWILGRMYKTFRNYDYVAEFGGIDRKLDPLWSLSPNIDLRLQLPLTNQIVADHLIHDLLLGEKFFDENYAKEVLFQANSMRKLPLRLSRFCNDIISAIFRGVVMPLQAHNLQTDIFVAGFQYSGSSAVSDWLGGASFCQYVASQDMYPFTGLKEFMFIFKDMFNLYKDAADSKPNLKKDLLEFFLTHILAFFYVDNRKSFVLRIYHAFHTAYCASEIKYKQLLDFTYQFILNLNYIALENQDIIQLRAIIASYFSNLSLICNAEPAKYLVFDNAITAWECNYLEMMPHGTIFLIVIRDPRDSFISIHDNEGWTCNDFINTYKIRIQRAYEYCLQNSKKYKIIPVCFERFVNEPSYRDRLAAHIGIENGIESRYFKPEYSKTRIGKYKTFLDKNAINAIADTFAEVISGEYIRKYPNNIEDE